MDDLSNKIKNACLEDGFHGLSISRDISMSPSFFVDDILVFGILSRRNWVTLHYNFCRFHSASELLINKGKSFLLFVEGKQEDIEYIANIFGVETQHINHGLKYLGYNIKPNNYKFNH